MKTLNEDVDLLMMAIDLFEMENGPEMTLHILEAAAKGIQEQIELDKNLAGQEEPIIDTVIVGDNT